MRSGTARSSVSDAESRELRATAAVFESAAEANPADITALEALREIYARLGDLEKLLATVERIEASTPSAGVASDADARPQHRGGGQAAPPPARAAAPPRPAVRPSAAPTGAAGAPAGTRLAEHEAAAALARALEAAPTVVDPASPVPTAAAAAPPAPAAAPPAAHPRHAPPPSAPARRATPPAPPAPIVMPSVSTAPIIVPPAPPAPIVMPSVSTAPIIVPPAPPPPIVTSPVSTAAIIVPPAPPPPTIVPSAASAAPAASPVPVATPSQEIVTAASELPSASAVAEPPRVAGSDCAQPTHSPETAAQSPATSRGVAIEMIDLPRPAPAAGRRRHRGRLGDVLVAEGVISPEQLADALKEHRRSKERLGSVLARWGLVTEEQLVELLSKEHGLPSVRLEDYQVEASVLALVPPHIARKYEVLPLTRAAQGLTLAMADPANVVAQDEVAALTRLEILPVVASAASIRQAITHYYTRAQTDGMSEILAELNGDVTNVEIIDSEETPVEVIELRESADEAPVVRLVNRVLVDAIRRGASDLHWEPYEKVFRIRFRVDGVLHEVVQPPKRHEPAIISRLKIMANLDISERRLPQDGRIKLRHGRREIDFRVSILPTIFGEKAVLRILDKDSLKLDLTQLGFDQWALEKFTHAIHQPYGMVLITGPTGSGKTTTLYSAIHTINSPGHNIMTAEDPVEYNLRGVNQVQVNESIGRTFAAVLRSFLRQDPDVILVGETRDLETAQISIRAALTGHLVFTTLHTNDSPTSIARLLDMGIPAFLLSSSLRIIVAQRLARKICRECREPFEGHENDLVQYGHVPTGVGRTQFWRGRGCQACGLTGMKGRVAIYEVMPITDELRELVLKEASIADLRETAERAGMKTLRQAGLAKVLEGTTTLEEVLRVTLT